VQTGLNIGAVVLELIQHVPDRRSVRPDTKDRPTLEEWEFRTFYEETSRPLFAYLLRVSRERALAEDLVQESYCRLLSAKQIPQDPVHRRTYLFRIATNLMRDRWRRIKNNKEESLPDCLSDEASSDADHDLSMQMRRALGQLKDRERQLLWLAYVEGSSHKEIADSTGLKEGSIRLLLFRARRRLASIIRGKTPIPDPEGHE
jgi:RNA polymerase sigma-70 factor (ECF subfamily)